MSDAVALALIAAVIAPTTAAIIAAIGNWKNSKKLKEVHDAVNEGMAAQQADTVNLKAEIVKLQPADTAEKRLEEIRGSND